MAAPRPTAAGLVSAGGLELYCERYGDGPPLVLLHGAFGTIGSCFARLLPTLARDFEVIAVELPGHGRSPGVDRPLSYEGMAAGTAAALEALGVGRAHLVGYSMGGAVAMQLALDRPDLAERVVYAGGASFDPSGIQPELTALAEDFDPHALDGTRWHQAYCRVAPDPDAWTALVTRIGELDRAGLSWSRKRLAALQSATLIIVGDGDIVRPEHAVELFRLLGGGGVLADQADAPRTQLAVLPGTSHEGLLDRVDWLSSMIRTFLGAGEASPCGSS